MCKTLTIPKYVDAKEVSLIRTLYDYPTAPPTDCIGQSRPKQKSHFGGGADPGKQVKRRNPGGRGNNKGGEEKVRPIRNTLWRFLLSPEPVFRIKGMCLARNAGRAHAPRQASRHPEWSSDLVKNRHFSRRA